MSKYDFLGPASVKSKSYSVKRPIQSSNQQMNLNRQLRLEVVWSRITLVGKKHMQSYSLSSYHLTWMIYIYIYIGKETVKQQSTPFDLKPGEIIERYQFKLELFEVFRCQWKHEKHRVSLFNEWKSLSACYYEYNI